MSSVVISGDISGSVTLDAPSVAGTTVLTLPATSGTVVTTATSSGISGSAITTGTVGVSVGGTGANTLTANNVILGNGTSAVQFVAPGSSGNVLTSNGTTWTSAAAGGGQLQTQVFTAPGIFTTPASTTRVRVTVVGGGGGGSTPAAGAGPASPGGSSSFGSLVSATGGGGGSGAPGGTTPGTPGTGTISAGTTIFNSDAGRPPATTQTTYISGAFVGGSRTGGIPGVPYSITNREVGAGAVGSSTAQGGAGGLAVAVVPVTVSTPYAITVGAGGAGANNPVFHGGVGGVVVVEFVG